ncbi:APC family permease [Streptomyces sp. NP160]|uniref:APC family permease n=1 Tax=Streptomyces sp. NP160 TaxID=2586637 RepID=UPI00111913F0|nr:APC family permease [Streptomyces sp. NP160]TNM68006.1 APC family permease [Streptomyces sp. NP160]
MSTTSATPPSTGGEGESVLADLGYKQELRRSLTTTDLLVYGLVFMVPIAPWAIFGGVYNSAAGMVPLVYAIGLFAMIFTALAYAQMSKAFPVAGSVYAYVGRGVHPNLGFLAGWTILLDYLLVPTLLYVIAALSMQAVVPGVPGWVWIVVFLAINTTVNYVGISFTAVVNRIFLAAELLFIAAFVVIAVLAISNGTGGARFTTTPLFNAAEFSPALLATALSIAVLSFLGFDGIATLSEESRGGRSSAGKAMVLGLVVVALLFITQTWLAGMLVPDTTSFPEGLETDNAFFNIVQGAAGRGWQVAFLVMNVLAVGIANAVAAQSATSRLLFSMARDRRLPGFLAHVNPRNQVPDRAILLIGGLTLVLGLVFNQLGLTVIASLVNFGALTAFMLLHVSVVSYHAVRKRSGNVLLHVVVPVVGFVVIGYVLVNAGTQAQVGGLCWLAVGVVVLLVQRARGRRGIEVAPEHAAR